MNIVSMRQDDVTKSAEYIGLQKLTRFSHFISRKVNRFSFKLRLMLYRMEFGERDDDIYIVTFPKSGTTITQVILYQLITNGKGSMDFKHIYDVSPWVANDVHFGRPVRKNLPSPRIIKSHEYYRDYEKSTKGRFIYVYRNGMDVCVSLYNQNKNYNNPDLKFDDFFKNFTADNKHNWFRHVHEWFINKNKLNILYVRYEDLVLKKEEEIRRIAEFLGLELSSKAVENALKFSSFDYMKKNETKFGVQPPDSCKRVFNKFIRKGKTGEGEKTLSSEQQNIFQKRLNKFSSRRNNQKIPFH